MALIATPSARRQNQAVVDLRVQLDTYRNNHGVAVKEKREEDVHGLAHKISDLDWAVRILEVVNERL